MQNGRPDRSASIWWRTPSEVGELAGIVGWSNHDVPLILVPHVPTGDHDTLQQIPLREDGLGQLDGGPASGEKRAPLPRVPAPPVRLNLAAGRGDGGVTDLA